MNLSRLALAALAVVAGAKQPPHLAFILVDDLGFNDFSYRSSDLQDVWPNVNNMLNASVKIDTYYTQPLCTPTRAAFMTGRYPARLGLQHMVISGAQDYGLPLDEVTLADKLRGAGYRTYINGKWHLGCYNFASTPTARGFDEFVGYWNGMEDYLTHEIQGYLDFHHQTGPTAADYHALPQYSGNYSTFIYVDHVSQQIVQHKANHADSPAFFYLPLQNVHAPLESPGEPYDTMCASIPDADRRTFCAMAAAADDAIGNITRLMAKTFAGEDFLVVVSGDNGGMPMDSGNNWPLRGHKAELWEGGVRNNAILWGPLVPSAARGTTYSAGLVHITDWHVTLATLAGANLTGKGPLDGHDVWEAATTGAPSPRDGFLVNYDPCSGHGACSGIEWAYRMGDYKLIVGASNDTWYPVPTAAADDAAAAALAASTARHDSRWGSVTWEEDEPLAEATGATPSASCVAAVKAACPDGTIDCNGCIAAAWKAGTVARACSNFSSDEATLSGWFCYGATAWLFNITADPEERVNIISANPDVVDKIKNQIDSLLASSDYMAPCNIPGGSCNADDPNAAAVMAAHSGWYPWVDDANIRAAIKPPAAALSPGI